MDIQNSYRKIIEIMKNILEEIAARTRERIAKEKSDISVSELENRIQEVNKNAGQKITFLQALQKDGMSYICEVKKASPSKGLIAPDFPYLAIAKEYEQAGASAISCLTEPFYFQGADRYLREIAATVKIPVLRKDFTVDEYMIYEAKVLGASAVLLICSIFSEEQIKSYISICDELGLSALVEAHDENEVQTALHAGARIVGVNNRNLKDFSVDTDNSRRLRELIPRDMLFVSESGVSSAEDISKLREIGVDAVLIGEVLMRAPDKKTKLDELRGTI